MSFARMLVSSVAPRVVGLLQKCIVPGRCLHLLARTPQPAGQMGLLRPLQSLQVVPACGLKQKGVLKKRCKDCYFVYRDSRKYVMCKTHPRHKATAFAPREKFTWIVSPGPMQGKERPW
jgi:large subunit ribosomal protein L36